ncbi:hypothetical protein [Vibrio phage Va2]|nr:hypothetical protein [Vibrio phage Va2]
MTLSYSDDKLFRVSTVNLSERFKKDKNVIVSLDVDGETVDTKFKSKYHDFDGVECNLYSEESGWILISSIKRRIREIDYLMSIGKIPPPGTRVIINSGLLQGKTGVVVGSKSGEALVRFYDSSESYVLGISIKDCSLLSGSILRVEPIEKVKLFT